MLVSIGKRKPPEDLVGLLLECHQRIRSFIRIAEEIGRRADLAAPEVVEGSQGCERYFAEAFPLHVEDEETSLLPRLHDAGEEVDAALARMHAQHAQHCGLVMSLLAALRAVASHPGEQTHRGELLRVAALLREAFEQHLALEEEVIFPAIRAYWSKETEAEVMRELRARRQAGGAST